MCQIAIHISDFIVEMKWNAQEAEIQLFVDLHFPVYQYFGIIWIFILIVGTRRCSVYISCSFIFQKSNIRNSKILV